MFSQRFLNIQNFAGMFSQLSIYNFDLEETGALVSLSYPILWYLSYSGAFLTTSRKEMHKACRKPKNWKTAEQDEKKKIQICYTLCWPLTQQDRNLTGCILAFSLSCLWSPSCICPCQKHITSPGWYAYILALMILLLGADQIFYISYTELIPTPFSFAIPYLVCIWKISR